MWILWILAEREFLAQGTGRAKTLKHVRGRTNRLCEGMEFLQIKPLPQFSETITPGSDLNLSTSETHPLVDPGYGLPYTTPLSPF